MLAILFQVGTPGFGEEPIHVDPWAQLDVEIRELGLEPESLVIPGRVNDEMRQWLQERIPAGASPDAALRQLLVELTDPAGFELAYDPSFTGTAEEVWTTRKANCLGFTHLYVGLTRELGLPTYYVRWSRVERFRREGDLVLVSGHVSAGYGAGHQMQVLEFGAVSGFEGHLALPISDLNAMARHHANRSAELLQKGMLAEAVGEAELAVQLDASLADGWVNLGVSRRRSGDMSGAEAAYRRATLEDPDHVPAYQNLSTLLQLQGAADAAKETLALLDRRDNRNPFTYLALGDFSLESDRYGEAERFYRKAHRLAPGLADTRAARGILAFEEGEMRLAQKWLRRAREVDPNENRTLELADKISRTSGPSE